MKSLSSDELILNTLRGNRVLSPHDLSVECSLTEPAVRYHLRKFLTMGIIEEFSDPEPGLRAGRKATLYKLVNPTIDQNVAHLCHILLQHIPKFAANDVDLSEILADWYLSDREDQRELPLRELITWLNNRNYSASWEAGKLGPVVIFSNCPYRQIRTGNEVLCRMDASILNRLTHRSWEQVEIMNWEILHGTCRFIVKPQACK
jgi:predicted ArsR family transcriptional regulator